MTINISPFDEEFDTMMEVSRNPHGAWQAIQFLSAALSASQAETAAVYEAAARFAAGEIAALGYSEFSPFLLYKIRALTPADSKAALDRMLEDARAETPVAWQPFETAPYDTPILVWYVNRIISCIVPKASKGAYVWVQVLDGFRDGFQLGVKPSHWMPCPTNPDAEIIPDITKGKDHE